MPAQGEMVSLPIKSGGNSIPKTSEPFLFTAAKCPGHLPDHINFFLKELQCLIKHKNNDPLQLCKKTEF